MRTRTRITMLAGTTLTALALVTGCGTDAGSPSPAPEAVATAPSADGVQEQEAADLLGRAYDAVVASGSARYSMSVEVTAQGQTRAMNGTGSFDFARNVGAATMDGASLGLPGSVEVIVEGADTYLQVPGRPGWFRMPPTASGQYDPTAQLEMLRRVADDLQIAGSEQVDGEEMRRVTFAIDVAELVAAQGGTTISPSDAEGMGTMPGTMWVDAQDRLRKVEFRGGDASGSMRTAVEFTDFGVPVTVQVPDPAQVQDLPTG
jgi:hypothetical protein